MKKPCTLPFACLGSLVLLLSTSTAQASGPAVTGTVTDKGGISVYAAPNSLVSVFKLAAGATICDQSAVTNAGAAIQTQTDPPGGPLGTATGSQTIAANPTVFKLPAAVAAGDVYCLVANTGPGTDTSYVIVQPFAAPPVPSAIPAKEPSFAHSFYTVGAVISNQLSSSNSTTAAQYVDLGFSFKFRNETPPIPKTQANKNKGVSRAPGFDTSFSGRFTSIPVAAGGVAAVTVAPSISTGPIRPNEVRTAADAATDTSSPLNVLSSQESARVMGTAFVPWRGHDTTPDGDALYFGPVAKASFSTLINPSQTVAPATGTVLVAPQFAPTYNDWSLGGRLGWRRYSGNSAQTVWQIDTTVGKFTNLEDIFCNHKFPTAGVATAPTNTSCFTTIAATTSGGTPTYTTYRPDRVSNPRIELDGFAHIPGTIFVIGIDANLSQYEIGNKYTDTMNRAGSDVRIYFGITGSISDLFKKLSLPAAP